MACSTPQAVARCHSLTMRVAKDGSIDGAARNAAFTPLQVADWQAAPSFSNTQPTRTLKRHECRAPMAAALTTARFWLFTVPGQ
jgi:hypothetical protein